MTESKPLTATLGERMPFLTLLSDKKTQEAPPRRPAGTRRRIVDAKELWPPPKPDRQLIAPPEKGPEPVPRKKAKRTRYDDVFKAGVVKRALEAKQTGDETIQAIAKDLGISRANLDNWVRRAKTKRPKSKARANKGNGSPALPANGTSLSALSRDLDAALANVSAIKKRLRAMLEDE